MSKEVCTITYKNSRKDGVVEMITDEKLTIEDGFLKIGVGELSRGRKWRHWINLKNVYEIMYEDD